MQCTQKWRLAAGSAAAGLLVTSVVAAQSATGVPGWSPGELAVTGGGCPIETPDALSLMFASGRPGGLGDIDIWVVDRTEVGGDWSEPKNLPGMVNSDAADFCPAPLGDRTLYFVSSRAHPDACGGADIYLSRQSPAGDWGEPEHLPCAPDGPNTPGVERSPSFIETWYGKFLFFSTNEGVADADDDIYVSIIDAEGGYSRGYLVDSLSEPDIQDQMPTVREPRPGVFEITFNSNRAGTRQDPAFGGQDAYWSRTTWLPFWWSRPRNAGPNVNTDADETRASLSSDGQRFYVGRGDIYVSERQ
jgi:hypothetical protein